MTVTDKRNILANNPYTYKILKDNRVQIFWHKKPVMILRGSEAVRLLNKLTVSDDKETQLILARITGNFKRGNERPGKKR